MRSPMEPLPKETREMSSALAAGCEFWNFFTCARTRTRVPAPCQQQRCVPWSKARYVVRATDQLVKFIKLERAVFVDIDFGDQILQA